MGWRGHCRGGGAWLQVCSIGMMVWGGRDTVGPGYRYVCSRDDGVGSSLNNWFDSSVYYEQGGLK